MRSKFISALFVVSDNLRYLLAIYTLYELFTITSAFVTGAIAAISGELGRLIVASYGLPLWFLALLYLISHLILLVGIFQLHYSKTVGVVIFIVGTLSVSILNHHMLLLYILWAITCLIILPFLLAIKEHKMELKHDS